MNEAITAELDFAYSKFKARIKPTYVPIGWICSGAVNLAIIPKIITLECFRYFI